MNQRTGGSGPELVATGLGFPEGPALLPGGDFVCVDSYRGQLTRVGQDRKPRPFAQTGGAPNSCVMGDDGAFYVCQNGGTTGPWRADKMIDASIQVVREGGSAEVLITEVAGIRLNGPNDLCFCADGSLVFSDPGTYNPQSPDPSYIHRILPDGTAKVLVAFPKPVFPNGVAVEADGSVLWAESYTGHLGRIRTDGTIEDLGAVSSERTILDGLKVAADGRIFVTDFIGKGIHVVSPRGKLLDFIPCGAAPTNCVFDGESMWVTDVGLTSLGTVATSEGRIWKLHAPGGGVPTHRGRIARKPRS